MTFTLCFKSLQAQAARIASRLHAVMVCEGRYLLLAQQMTACQAGCGLPVHSVVGGPGGGGAYARHSPAAMARKRVKYHS